MPSLWTVSRHWWDNGWAQLAAVQCVIWSFKYSLPFKTIHASVRAGQLAAGGVASVWRSWVRSPPGPRQFIYSFVGLYAFPCARASKLNQQICISPAPGRSSKLTHTGVEIDTMCIPDRLSVVQCSHGHVIGVAFFWRDFSGVKRTCWTTGSWRSCLSLEVVSSIPAWSTIIYRFLCGFIYVSLCQSIKIKPTNMYVCMYVCMFESCSQQRKTTSLLSIRKSLACARASKLTTTNMYIARARCECQMAVGSGGLNACWS